MNKFEKQAAAALKLEKLQAKEIENLEKKVRQCEKKQTTKLGTKNIFISLIFAYLQVADLERKARDLQIEEFEKKVRQCEITKKRIFLCQTNFIHFSYFCVFTGRRA